MLYFLAIKQSFGERKKAVIWEEKSISLIYCDTQLSYFHLILQRSFNMALNSKMD